MPRSRMVRPEFVDDRKLATISRDARLLFILLWIYSDDYGVVQGTHLWIRNKVFPLEEIPLKQIDRWMEELTEIDCLRFFEINGEPYYWIRNFLKYQVINRPSQTRNPEPPQALIESSRSTHTPLNDSKKGVNPEKTNNSNNIPSLTEPSLSPHGTLTPETETEVNKKVSICASEIAKREVEKNFEDFWKVFPRKENRKNAHALFLKIYKNGKGPPFPLVLNALKNQLTWPKWTDDHIFPHATTWLNQERWTDEPPPGFTYQLNSLPQKTCPDCGYPVPQGYKCPCQTRRK